MVKTEMTRRLTSRPNVWRTSKAEEQWCSATEIWKWKMANLYKLALYTGVFAVLFQLLCLLMSWNILGVIGALILSFIAGYVLLWLIEYHMPRKIMYCKDKAVLITGNRQMS